MLDLEKYTLCARKVISEGCVLLKNDNGTLPLKKNDRVAVFGVNAFYYYKSGLGSGGMVNTAYVVSVLDALKNEKDITVDGELLSVYENWINKNPFDEGSGWGMTPWSQEEMPLSNDIVDAARKRNDVAVVLIGRTAGEDQDNTANPKSFLLSQKEEDMIEKVSKAFERTVVLLNVGNIIDMKWVGKYNPGSVMYIWQGGQEGGNGVADVLTGRVNPCGKLTDTIAYDVDDYLSNKQFGHDDKNYYEEDIYVGYRYFESKEDKSNVLYPFGFGLSYTSFEINAKLAQVNESEIVVEASVTNIGACDGKEIVEVYVEAPQGQYAKPKRVLAGFAKTPLLKPNETVVLTIPCKKEYFATFDEDGRTGNESCFVLEAGEYKIYAGGDVRNVKLAGSLETGLTVLSKCTKAMSPCESYKRYVLKENDGKTSFDMEDVKANNIIPDTSCTFEEIKQNFDTAYDFTQVYNGEVSMEDFIAQLTDDDLICMARGEGMCSIKVTPGTAGAFGGLTPALNKMKVPALCCADGPSGIRMDCGTKAFSLPNGTLIGCTFNLELIEELFEHLGKELRKNKIDTILGPGINIHRHPLNGRNFEYISEDPVLTGKICVAELKGLHKYGVTGTIKHFCANNQEKRRCFVESVVSERALREIYLKPFEIAVKEGNARSVMTTYGPVNGVWTAGNHDLNTKILRGDWGFEGIVMSDWWAVANWYGEPSDNHNHAAMAIAQNDVFMLCPDTIAENDNDNMVNELREGRLTRAQLQRNAKNILTFALKSPAMERMLNKSEDAQDDASQNMDGIAADCDFAVLNPGDDDRIDVVVKDTPKLLNDEGFLFGVVVDNQYKHDLTLTYKSQSGELAQIPVSLYIDNVYTGTLSLRGTSGEEKTFTKDVQFNLGQMHYIKLIFKTNQLEITRLSFVKKDKR